MSRHERFPIDDTKHILQSILDGVDSEITTLEMQPFYIEQYGPFTLNSINRALGQREDRLYIDTDDGPLFFEPSQVSASRKG